MSNTIDLSYRPETYGSQSELDECTIATVLFNSAPGSGVSIIASRLDHGQIAYKVVDDEGELIPTSCEPTSEPLTMGELIVLIETTPIEEGSSHVGLVRGSLDLAFGAEAASDELRDAAGFILVESDYYPHLKRWSELEAERWVSERAPAG